MNENEHLNPLAQQLARYMHRYMTALEHGDSDTLLLLLQEAKHDPALERVILEVNAMYQSADGLVVTPKEAQDAHQFLHSLLPSAQPTDMVLLTTTTTDEHVNGKYDTVPLLSLAWKSAHERIDSAVEMISSPETRSSTPLSNNRRSRKRPPTPARLHRLGRFVQMLAAVLVVAALIGSFAFVAVTHFKVQVGSSNIGKLNGTWHLVPNPNPGATDNQLQGIVALSTDDAWAVGSYKNQFGAKSYTLIEHWNGKQWQVVQSPNPGSAYNSLNGVAAIAPNNVWAVGSSSNDIHILGGQPLIERWNGSQWTVVQNPPGSDQSSLQAITALSTNDIWVVGGSGLGTFTEHWNGTTWTVVPSPNLEELTNTLMSVKALSANDVWAVGFAEGNISSSGHSQKVQRTLIEHWDGTKWSVVPSPNISGRQCSFYGIDALAPNNVLAVGGALNYSAGTSNTLVERWNGTRWSVMGSPNVGSGNLLVQVSTISANNAWAVGYYLPLETKKDLHNVVSHTLTEHWDGTRWSVIASPNPKAMSNVFASPGQQVSDMNMLWAVVGVPGSNQVWAVGYHSQATSLSFIERFS